jgi:hypothetical protein
VRLYASLWLRGFAIVFLTATNVVNITQRHWVVMFLTGGAISLVWRWNARNAVRVDSFAADVCYAFGAAVGTVSGAWVARSLFP